MRKVFLTLIASLACAVSVSAQDLAKLTEIYNNGATALGNGEKTSALASFQEALKGAEALGDPGKDLVANCKDIIPSLVLSISKDSFKDGDFDGAIKTAQEAAALAEKYGNADVVNEANDLIKAFNEQKAASLLKNKDYAGAIAAYTELLAANPNDGKLLFRLGQAYEGSGDADKAIETYLKASQEEGDAKPSFRKIANIYLKQSSAALKAKDYKTALEKAEKSNEYSESANAFKIAGMSAVQLKQYAKGAEALGKYLEMNPSAQDAAQIKQTIDYCNKQPK